MRLAAVGYVFFLLLGVNSADCQSVHGQIEGGLGSLIRHSEKFAFPSDELCHSLDISIQWATDDKQWWASYYTYPDVGLHLRHHTFGNRTVLGRAISFYPSVHIPMSRGHKGGQWTFMLGAGLAYITRPFNPIHNPINTAIGSKWNNITRLKFQYSRTYNTGRYGVYADFTHNSNGRISTPNTGLNTVEIGLSLSREPSKKSMPEHPSSPFRIRKWSVEGSGMLAFTSAPVYPGPKFPIYIARLAITRSITPVQRLHLGLEWERNMERAHFHSGVLGVTSRAETLEYATSHLLYIGDEFIFGPVSFGVVAGIYLQTQLDTFPIYNQIFTRVYFLQNKKHAGAFFTIYLKSHIATAQYFGFGLGYQL